MSLLNAQLYLLLQDQIDRGACSTHRGHTFENNGKSEIIDVYDSTKEGEDNLDQKCTIYYCTGRRTNDGQRTFRFR